MYLDKIADEKRKYLEKKKGFFFSEIIKRVEKDLAEGEKIDSLSLYEAVSNPGLSIIGEIKKASPSKGILNKNLDIIKFTEEYNKSVDAISVLSEEKFFNGSPWDIKAVSKVSKLPILMKDFVIDESQIYASKYFGANAVLLISSILSEKELVSLYNLAEELGIESLIEIHNEKDLEKALKADAKLIGINNRNLTSFNTDLATTVKLSKLIPKEILRISESGISSEKDIVYLKEGNIDGVLVGESFIKTNSISELARSFKNA